MAHPEVCTQKYLPHLLSALKEAFYSFFQKGLGLAVLDVEVEACLPPCLPHPGEGLKQLPELPLIGVSHGFGGHQDHLVGLKLLAIF